MKKMEEVVIKSYRAFSVGLVVRTNNTKHAGN